MTQHTPCALYAHCSVLAEANAVRMVADGIKPRAYLAKWRTDCVRNAKTCYLLVQEGTFTGYVPVAKSWVRSRINDTNHPDGLIMDICHKHCAHGALVVSMREHPAKI